MLVTVTAESPSEASKGGKSKWVHFKHSYQAVEKVRESVAVKSLTYGSINGTII